MSFSPVITHNRKKREFKMQKILMSKEDRKYLEELLAKKKDTFYEIPLIVIPATFLLVIIPTRHNPSYFSQYGFFVPAGIIFLLILLFAYGNYYFTVNALKKDIISNEKLLSICQIIDKDTTLKNECYIKINSTNKKFERHKIDINRFSNIKIGDSITLEYTEHSETFLRIIF
jgi:hypothetical protein